MSVTDRFSSFLQFDARNIHEAAKKGLWLSVFTGLFGLLISGTVVIVLIATEISLAGGDELVLNWAASKGITLIATLVLIVPIVRLLRWVSNRVNRSSRYAWAATDLILAFAMLILGFLVMVYAVDTLDTHPNARSPVGNFLMMGYYFIFAGIGTASATAWLFAATTLALYLRHIHLDTILSKLMNTFQFLWEWMYYPKLWYQYAKANRMTLGGSLFSLLRHGCHEIVAEMENGVPIESEINLEPENSDRPNQ